MLVKVSLTCLIVHFYYINLTFNSSFLLYQPVKSNNGALLHGIENISPGFGRKTNFSFHALAVQIKIIVFVVYLKDYLSIK